MEASVPMAQVQIRQRISAYVIGYMYSSTLRYSEKMETNVLTTMEKKTNSGRVRAQTMLVVKKMKMGGPLRREVVR